MASYREKFGHAPSAFSAQGFDSMQLIASGIDGVSGNVSDKPALLAAMRRADFHSVRGSFSFNTNQFPIENFYLTEVENGPSGPATRTVKPVAEAAHDEMAAECPMK